MSIPENEQEKAENILRARIQRVANSIEEAKEAAKDAENAAEYNDDAERAYSAHQRLDHLQDSLRFLLGTWYI